MLLVIFTTSVSAYDATGNPSAPGSAVMVILVVAAKAVARTSRNNI
jgi:hypothetical protein